MKKGGVVAFKGVTGSHPYGWGGRQPPAIPPVNNVCAQLAFSRASCALPAGLPHLHRSLQSSVLFEVKIQ